jgi:hypothetical protein
LGDGESRGRAVTAAVATEVARQVSRGVYDDLPATGRRDLCSGDRNLQLSATHNRRGQRSPIPSYDRGRVKVAAIHGKQQPLLDLTNAGCVRCERDYDWLRSGTSAERIAYTATGKEHD